MTWAEPFQPETFSGPFGPDEDPHDLRRSPERRNPICGAAPYPGVPQPQPGSGQFP